MADFFMPGSQKSENELFALAEQHRRAGHPVQARNIYREILGQNPGNDRAWGLLAGLFANSREYATAEKYLLRAIGINPDFTGYRIDLGMVYCYLHQWDKAIDINHKILQKDRDNVFALFNMGYALRGKGDLDKSIDYFERVYGLRPNFVDAYVTLCSVFYRLKMIDRLTALMKKMETVIHSLNSVEQGVVCFTLGRYYDHLDEYDKAFSYLEKANALKLGGARYDLDRDAAFIRQIADNVTPEFLDTYNGCGIRDSSPIFIIGMPRSGTSLIEQILSCHPEVNAGGELQYFYGWASSFDYSSVSDSCEKLAKNYLNAAAPVKKDSKYLTDKLPHNFLYAGLIHLCLPSAKIIHCTRDPMDTCFSCYKQDFSGSHYYVYDMLTLGRYYNVYREHMRHWHEVMPGRLLDVKYEDVVDNLKKEVARILEYCGLPWSDDCLNFHGSSRFVDTASRDQVVKPIYRSSVGRWKYYEKYLTPLKEALQAGLEDEC